MTIGKEAICKVVSRMFVCTTLVVACTGSPSEVIAQDPPTPLKELLLNKDPLLRKIFAKSPDDDVKGLAASIKADEITVKQRIKAVKYLATVDCVAYPEAKAMLVKMLHKDKWEPVRYEAAEALRIMLATGARSEKQDPERFDGWMSRWRRNHRRSRGEDYQKRYDYCPGCCDKDTLNALVKTAYEMNDRASCFEPSLRVRQKAVEAIRSCGVPCNAGPYYGEGSDLEEPGPPPLDVEEKKKGEVPPPSQVDPGEVRPPSDEGEVTPPTDGEPDGPLLDIGTANRNRVPASRVSLRATTRRPETTVIPSLNGYCVVSLMHGQKKPAYADFQSAYRGRLYHFSSLDAKVRFDRTPATYAVAYGGFDPVQFVKSRQMLEGRFLAEYQQHLYCFASHENWQEFLRSPSRFAMGVPSVPAQQVIRQAGHATLRPRR
ncbi:MAG: hypothetical protein AB8G99_07670 [Planctomycetaceae bacterium]